MAALAAPTESTATECEVCEHLVGDGEFVLGLESRLNRLADARWDVTLSPQRLSVDHGAVLYGAVRSRVRTFRPAPRHKSDNAQYLRV